MNIFADLDTPDLSVHSVPAKPLAPAAPLSNSAAHAAAYGGEVFVEICQKCRGSGIYYGRSSRGTQCFPCNGKGRFERKTSPEARAKAKAGREARKVRTAAAAFEAFKAQHPEAGAWIEAKAGTFNFAASMKSAVERWGHLTPGQLAAVERIRAQDAERAERKAREAEERVAREAAAPEITVAKIEEAFAAARAAGKKRLKLRLDTFIFKPAPATGRNAGALYVTEGENYLGKVVGGRFMRVRECEEVTAERVIAAAADPKAAAIAYGQRTGSCSCCGAELTNKASIDLGIGPICASKWGW